jgi:phosphatidylinositol-3-phosphatase
MMTRFGLKTLVIVALLMPAGCGGTTASGPPSGQASSPASVSQPPTAVASPAATTGAKPAAVPEPAHTVVVVMENHAYEQIIGDPAAPFINTLARRGALFTRSYAITHPSEPNYLALFSGSTQGIADDGCPYRFTAPNLAADLLEAGKSFAGYAEDLPGPGSPVCSALHQLPGERLRAAACGVLRDPEPVRRHA